MRHRTFMKFYRHLLFLTRSRVLLHSIFIRADHLKSRRHSCSRRARLEQVSPNTLTNYQPNLVQGRELNQPQAVALDLSVNPPHLYVADTFNNRVLCWNVPTQFANGAFADLVIGQSDLLTTLPQGPFVNGSTRPSSGMTSPMGMVVDGKGNLYIIDAGNNRILRFPQPFNQNGNPFPDMVIGQRTLIQGLLTPEISAGTLAFSSSSGVSQAYLKFDSANNLWVADVLNNRVLRYPASVLATGANGPSADIVIGQPDFSSNSATQIFDPTSTSILRSPTGIAFDQSGGRLYVSESQPGTSTTAIRSRILVYNPPFASNQSAGRIIGTVAANNPVQPPLISASQLGASATDVFNINNNIAVADTTNNRILIYNPFQQFTADTLTQAAQVVLGQADFNSGKANRGAAGQQQHAATPD